MTSAKEGTVNIDVSALKAGDSVNLRVNFAPDGGEVFTILPWVHATVMGPTHFALNFMDISYSGFQLKVTAINEEFTDVRTVRVVWAAGV
ncbi:hypothetical protein [Paraburkholderia sp. J67]|uniref:hypothetical protein n=1 Tax=Paraburkholderia sp. J67 TaxID=2805435 RepID=UPI002ABD8C5D|nr:hypothetical protein [Paraburkholderia sp. J67]